jgi:hypothetical protein
MRLDPAIKARGGKPQRLALIAAWDHVGDPAMPGRDLVSCRLRSMEDSKAIESDQRALEVVAAVGSAVLGLGAATVTDSAGGVVIGAALNQPLKFGLEWLSGLRGRQIAFMWDIAVRASEQSPEELLKRVTTDPHRAQLFWAASRAAANTALESKLKVLGQLLVDGLLHEDHEIHEARLLLTAIEELEQPHLRVLHHLTTSY